RRPSGRLPRRQRRGVRRVGRPPDRGAAWGRCPPRHRRRPARRPRRRRFVCDGCRRPRLPDPHPGGVGMTIPSSFAGLPLDGGAAAAPAPQGGEPWASPEGIDVLGVYGPEHLAGLDALDTLPGLSPFLRGPYPTMYTTQPWTIRQYAGFS